jgi:hypothetical protein
MTPSDPREQDEHDRAEATVLGRPISRQGAIFASFPAVLMRTKADNYGKKLYRTAVTSRYREESRRPDSNRRPCAYHGVPRKGAESLGIAPFSAPSLEFRRCPGKDRSGQLRANTTPACWRSCGTKAESRRRESNPRPHPYHGCALPAELRRPGASHPSGSGPLGERADTPLEPKRRQLCEPIRRYPAVGSTTATVLGMATPCHRLSRQLRARRSAGRGRADSRPCCLPRP